MPTWKTMKRRRRRRRTRSAKQRVTSRHPGGLALGLQSGIPWPTEKHIGRGKGGEKEHNKRDYKGYALFQRGVLGGSQNRYIGLHLGVTCT